MCAKKLFIKVFGATFFQKGSEKSRYKLTIKENKYASEVYAYNFRH